MARKANSDTIPKRRLTILCTAEQETIINDASKASGMESDRSAWLLAHAMAAAKKVGPIVIAGELADRLRSQANAQGITVPKLIEQLALANGDSA